MRAGHTGNRDNPTMSEASQPDGTEWDLVRGSKVGAIQRTWSPRTTPKSAPSRNMAFIRLAVSIQQDWLVSDAFRLGAPSSG